MSHYEQTIWFSWCSGPWTDSRNCLTVFYPCEIGAIARILRHQLPVMWSETIGLMTRPVSDQKNRSWSCRSGVVKHGLVMLVIIMILNDTATFQVLFVLLLLLLYSVLGTSLLWRSTVAFTYTSLLSRCTIACETGEKTINKHNHYRN